MSDVVGYIQEAPITSQRSFKTVATLKSGGVYLLCSLHRKEQSKGLSGILQSSFKNVDSFSSVQVWARIYRISGDYVKRSGGAKHLSDGGTKRKAGS